MSCSSSISIPEGSYSAGSPTVRPTSSGAPRSLANLSEAGESRSTPLRFLVHDRDHRFGEVFDEVFKAEGVEIIRTPWRAARASAYAERFVRTVRTEGLDRIFVLSERHLESVLKTYVRHYNQERPPPFPHPACAVRARPGSCADRRRRRGQVTKNRSSGRPHSRVPDDCLSCADGVLGTHGSKISSIVTPCSTPPTGTGASASQSPCTR